MTIGSGGGDGRQSNGRSHPSKVSLSATLFDLSISLFSLSNSISSWSSNLLGSSISNKEVSLG